MIKWIILVLSFFLMVKHDPIPLKQTETKPYYNIVKYLSNKYNKDEKLIQEYVNIVIRETTKYNIDPLLVLAMIETESGFNSRAYNQSGAMGLMQVIPRYHPDLITQEHQSLYDPNMGINVGVAVLVKFIEKHNGNFVKAINNYGGDSSGNYYKTIYRHLQEIEQHDI